MKEKKKFYEQWWFWLIFALIIVGVLIFTKLEVDKEILDVEEYNSMSKDKILVFDNETKKIKYLDEFKEIKQINDKIIQELSETFKAEKFNNKSADKDENEITIRDISEDKRTSYLIKYNIATNELEQITVTNFEEWSNTSTFLLLSMKMAQLTIFNFNEEQLAEVWNNIKTNKELNINTERWNIKNTPKMQVFSINRID